MTVLSCDSTAAMRCSESALLAEAVCLRVNLQPDKTGPMQRNRELLSGPDHDRTPPTQRLADPSRKKGSATEHAAAQSDQSGDHSRFYTTVLDRHATKQLRMPKTDGTSQSYRCALPTQKLY